MTRPEFYSTTPEEQQERLADLARAALPEWGLTDAELTPIAYRENMTFKVDAGGRGAFAFRIHQANYRTDAMIQSELDLMRYMKGQGILTPTVVPTESGALFTTAETPGVSSSDR